MNLMVRLKKVDWLRHRVKRAKIYREYFADARFMSRHLLDGGSSDQHREYRMLQLIHALEKGLSHRSPRAFGAAKAAELVRLMAGASPSFKQSTAYTMGLSVLPAWLAFHEDKSWGDADALTKVREFVESETATTTMRTRCGVQLIENRDPCRWRSLPIDEFVASRHSTRRFAAAPVTDDEVSQCVRLAMRSPSACNRQMVRLRIAEDEEAKKLLYETLHGTGGIDYHTCRLGVITFDARSLDFCGERNQGYLNVGLFAMTLVYAFHWMGIGSCLLQFGNTFAEERMLVCRLGIPPTERIGVGIAFGHLESSDVVPASVRRKADEVVSVLTNEPASRTREI